MFLVRAERPAGLDVREDALELRNLVAQSRISGLRLRSHPFEPFLDIVAVCDDELELECLEIPVGVGLGPEAAETPIRASALRSSPSTAGLRPGGSTTRTVAGVVCAEPSTAAIGSSRSSGIGSMPTCSFPYAPPGTPVRAVKSVVLPAPGRPTSPTSSGTSNDGTADLLPSAQPPGREEDLGGGGTGEPGGSPQRRAKPREIWTHGRQLVPKCARSARRGRHASGAWPEPGAGATSLRPRSCRGSPPPRRLRSRRGTSESAPGAARARAAR